MLSSEASVSENGDCPLPVQCKQKMYCDKNHLALVAILQDRPALLDVIGYRAGLKSGQESDAR